MKGPVSIFYEPSRDKSMGESFGVTEKRAQVLNKLIDTTYARVLGAVPEVEDKDTVFGTDQIMALLLEAGDEFNPQGEAEIRFFYFCIGGLFRLINSRLIATPINGN